MMISSNHVRGFNDDIISQRGNAGKSHHGTGHHWYPLKRASEVGHHRATIQAFNVTYDSMSLYNTRLPRDLRFKVMTEE